MTEEKTESKQQDKLVYFNRVEIIQASGEITIDLLERKDDDELFRLKEKFEKPKPKKKEVRK